MRRILRWPWITVSVLMTLAALGYGWYRHVFPYGHSHRCDKCLWSALHAYAEEHDGWYPRGQSTLEESLLLLLWEHPEQFTMLVDKRIPDSVVADMHGRGEQPTLDNCGWHYVEGLRKDDDGKLALFWDKAGLGHNGQRLSGGGHVVCFVHCNFEHITADRWEEFLEDQRKLRAALNRSTRDPLNPGPSLPSLKK